MQIYDLIARHPVKLKFNPTALKTAKTPWSFGRFECDRVNCIVKCAVIFVSHSIQNRRSFSSLQEVFINKHIIAHYVFKSSIAL